MNLVLIGPQGSGKGTQAQYLTEELGLKYLSSGELFQKLSKEDSSLGRQIHQLINIEGKLVPDEIVQEVIEQNAGERGKIDNLLFDGYPRTVKQFNLMLDWLMKNDSRLDRVIYLKISPDESIKRISSRKICSSCRRIYNLLTDPPKGNSCDLCGGSLEARPDDNPDVVKARLKNYYRQTEPIIEKARKMGILLEIDGEGSIEEIANDIKSSLKN